MKRQIAVLMLGGFLFPQGVNCLHYFISHHQVATREYTAEFSAPRYDYHFCNYQYNSLKGLSSMAMEQQDVLKVDLYKELNSVYHFEYVLEMPSTYRLRGPPQGKFFSA